MKLFAYALLFGAFSLVLQLIIFKRGNIKFNFKRYLPNIFLIIIISFIFLKVEDIRLILTYIFEILVVYLIGYELYRFFKYSEPMRDVILKSSFILSVLLSGIVHSPYLSMLMLILSVMIIIRFIQFPHLHPHFLTELMEKIALECDNGNYSSKPVVVGYGGKKFLTGTKGILIISTGKNLIIKMSKKTHERLGKPNLLQFTQKLSKEIWEFEFRKKSIKTRRMEGERK